MATVVIVNRAPYTDPSTVPPRELVMVTAIEQETGRVFSARVPKADAGTPREDRYLKDALAALGPTAFEVKRL